jgi:DNA-binding NtrC family response regulator
MQSMHSKPDVARPPYLHEKELADAIRAISLTASGRNPFSDEPFEKLRTEQRDSILQASCVVVSSLAYRNPLPTAESQSNDSMRIDAANATEGLPNRPLEAFLESVERKVIMEALQEAHFNRTAAAKLLGISFRALRYRLEQLGIADELDNQPR